MRRLIVLLGLLAVLVAGPASAQGPVLIQQAPSMLTAATAVAHADAAINVAVTATITVPAGMYAYITALDWQVCTNATATAQANVTWTSTNLTGLPKWQYSIGATVNICQTFATNFANPLKSAAPGTNVTVVSPTAAAQNAYSVNVYYFLAP